MEFNELLHCLINNIDMLIFLNISSSLYNNIYENTVQLYKTFIKKIKKVICNENIIFLSMLPNKKDYKDYKDGDYVYTNGNLYEFKITTYDIYTRTCIHTKTKKEFVKTTNPITFVTPITKKNYEKSKHYYKLLKMKNIDSLRGIKMFNLELLKIYKNMNTTILL